MHDLNRLSAEALSRNLLSRWRQINRVSSTRKRNTGLLPHRLALALERCQQLHDTSRPRSQKDERIEHPRCVGPRRGFEFDQHRRRQEVQLGQSPTINARQCKKTITSQWILTYKDGALFLQTCQVKPSALCRIAWPFKVPLACGLNCSRIVAVNKSPRLEQRRSAARDWGTKELFRDQSINKTGRMTRAAPITSY